MPFIYLTLFNVPFILRILALWHRLYSTTSRQYFARILRKSAPGAPKIGIWTREKSWVHFGTFLVTTPKRDPIRALPPTSIIGRQLSRSPNHCPTRPATACEEPWTPLSLYLVRHFAPNSFCMIHNVESSFITLIWVRIIEIIVPSICWHRPLCGRARHMIRHDAKRRFDCLGAKWHPRYMTHAQRL